MIRRHAFAMLFTLTAFTSTWALADEFSCWDQSFGYNTAHLSETTTRFELTLRGMMLERLDFDAVKLKKQYDATIYLAFPKNTCTIAPDLKSGKCDMTISWRNGRLFAGQNVEDLADKFVNIISPVYAKRVTVDFKLGETMNIHFFGSRFFAETTPDEQVLTLDLISCGKTETDIMGQFPQRLVDYLNTLSF